MKPVILLGAVIVSAAVGGVAATVLSAQPRDQTLGAQLGSIETELHRLGDKLKTVEAGQEELRLASLNSGSAPVRISTEEIDRAVQRFMAAQAAGRVADVVAPVPA